MTLQAVSTAAADIRTMGGVRLRMAACSLALAITSAAASADPVGHDCVLWIKADEGVTVDGASRVVAAVDQSGQGHNASNGAGGGPVLVAGAIGGRAAMRFSGGQWLDLAGQVLTSQQYTIVAVVTDTRTEGSFHEVISNWTFGNQGTSVFLGTTTIDPVGPGTTRVRLTDDVGGANQGQAGVGVVTARLTPFILTGISTAASAAVYQNRTLIASSTQPISQRNLSGPYVIGRQGPISEFWTGDIAEILVYNTALSVCELEAVYDSINGRYGLAPCLPTFTQQPAPITACEGPVRTLSVAVSGGTCSGNVTYRWTRNNQPIADGDLYTGTQTASLNVRGVRGAVEGDYRCIVTTTCGSVTSDPAAFVISCPNRADVAGLGGAPGCDGVVTADDIVFYLSQFFVGNTAVADLVGLGGGGGPDGAITPDDLVAFLAAFFAACP